MGEFGMNHVFRMFIDFTTAPSHTKKKALLENFIWRAQSDLPYNELSGAVMISKSDLRRSCQSSNNGCRQSATDHSVLLLVGAAWDRHQQGKKMASVLKMLSAIGLKPLRFSLWKGLAMLIIKSPR